MLSETAVETRLSGLPVGAEGAIVKLDYRRIVGRSTTDRQRREAAVAEKNGVDLTIYTIRLLKVWRSKTNGDLIINGEILFGRKNPDKPTDPVFRNFNVTKGNVLKLEVVS